MNMYIDSNYQQVIQDQNQEILYKFTENKNLENFEIMKFIEKTSTIDLLKISNSIRNKNNQGIITYSRKVFINLINLCKDSCSYCTYKKSLPTTTLLC